MMTIRTRNSEEGSLESRVNTNNNEENISKTVKQFKLKRNVPATCVSYGTAIYMATIDDKRYDGFLCSARIMHSH